MTEFCLICECEPVNREGWVFDQETKNAVCPWCITESREKGIGK